MAIYYVIKMGMCYKLFKNARLSQIRSDSTCCSICGGKLIRDHHYLVIYKDCTSSTPVNAWIHIDCVKKLHDSVENIKKNQEIMKKIMINNL
jgi:hypothetical protein